VLLWLVEAWKAYAHRAGNYQTRLMLTLVYLLVLGPAALLGRLFGARLIDLESGPTSTWSQRANSPDDKTLTALRRQF
jgi:hypothetical protein